MALALSKYGNNFAPTQSWGSCHAVTEGAGIFAFPPCRTSPTLRGKEWSEMALALSKYGNNFAPTQSWGSCHAVTEGAGIFAFPPCRHLPDVAGEGME
ncbi:hypothetical protein A4G13_06305 [Basfia succiniciproducens]|nr:hypothetical protein A4G13_06305 [Basfia succiniciproducens]